MQVFYRSKQYILRNFLVLGCIVLILTGCQKSQSSISFDSLISIDKTVNSVSNKEDAESIYDETTEAGNQKGNELLENFDSRNKKDYYTELDKMTKSAEKGTSVSKTAFLETHSLYTQFKLYAPLICFVSIFFGVIIFLFARGNKGARKFGLVGFVIVIPLLTIFLVYGIGFLYGIFVY